MNEDILWVSIFTGTASAIVGGFDAVFICMCFLILSDMVVGFFCAALLHKSKYTTSGVSSNAMMIGVVRKLCILLLVALSVQLDKALDLNYIRHFVVMYFIGTEGISLLEHMANIGVPIPKFLGRLLDTIKDEADEGGNQGADNSSANDQK